MNKQWLYFGYVAIAAGALAWAGCGDDSDTSGSDSTNSSSATTNSSSGSGAGGSMCDFDATDVCESCVASKCATEAAACCALTGCLDVVKCAQEKMCAGIDCYSPENCMAEIDAATLDVAQNEATAVGTCANVQCTTECGLPGEGGGGGTSGGGGAGGG